MKKRMWFSGEVGYRCYLHGKDESIFLSLWEFIRLVATMTRIGLFSRDIAAEKHCPAVLLAKIRGEK